MSRSEGFTFSAFQSGNPCRGLCADIEVVPGQLQSLTAAFLHTHRQNAQQHGRGRILGMVRLALAPFRRAQGRSGFAHHDRWKRFVFKLRHY